MPVRVERIAYSYLAAIYLHDEEHTGGLHLHQLSRRSQRLSSS
jgi:hypothetical protein